MTAPSPETRRARRQLLLVASIFLLPLAAAAWLYFSSGFRPAPSAQHGELVDPPRPVPHAQLRGSWFLIHVTGNSCDPRCARALAELQRVRLALDKDAARVKRVLLHAGECCGAGFPPTADADLLLLGAPGSEGAALLSLFPRSADGRAGIYVVDPHGNLILSYPATGSMQGLLKDLERLLRLSRIG